MEYETSLGDRLVPIGCGIIAIVLLIFVVVGAVTIYGWFI
jgi:hypothetical protein